MLACFCCLWCCSDDTAESVSSQATTRTGVSEVSFASTYHHHNAYVSATVRSRATSPPFSSSQQNSSTRGAKGCMHCPTAGVFSHESLLPQGKSHYMIVRNLVDPESEGDDAVEEAVKTQEELQQEQQVCRVCRVFEAGGGEQRPGQVKTQAGRGCTNAHALATGAHTQAHTHAHTRTHANTHTHAHTQTHTHAHTRNRSARSAWQLLAVRPSTAAAGQRSGCSCTPHAQRSYRSWRRPRGQRSTSGLPSSPRGPARFLR